MQATTTRSKIAHERRRLRLDQAIYIDKIIHINTVAEPNDYTNSPDITDPRINVELYDYFKLRSRSSSSSTSPTQISPRSSFTWSSVAADKNPAAAVIFDRRRRLRQDPPPP
jgi:hypothetical protein